MTNLEPGLVTIFGGSGFVGSQVVRAFARQGWRVRVAVRRPNTVLDAKTQGGVGQILAVRCDIRSKDDVVAAVRGATAVVNLVGLLYEGLGRSFQASHVEGARNVAEACAEAGIKSLVQVSAIGANAASPADYWRTKGEAEAIVRKLVPTATIVRPSVIFGPGDSFLNRFAQLSVMSPALPLIGDGETRFQPAYVGDVAEAVVRAVARPGKTFELGGPEILTFKQILELILRETRRKRILAPMPIAIARFMGAIAQQTALVGIAPILTRDQVLMLERDNVATGNGFAALGIDPTGVEAIAPGYLWRYRKGGQFSERSDPEPDFIPA